MYIMPLCNNLRWLLEELPRNNNDKLPAEDYKGIKDEVILNASMSLEDIYKRLAQGKPMELIGLQETQRLEPQGDFGASQRNEDLDTYEPFNSAPGSLDRMDEVQRRAQETINRLRNQSVGQESEQQDNQETETDNKPDYSAMRQAAKDEKKGKKQTE